MDEVIVSPTVHLTAGVGVLLTSLGALAVTGQGVRVRRAFGRPEHAALVLAQLALLVQALIGIKLLDQGFGTVQKYVHYLGGVGALGLLLLNHWLPPLPAQAQTRRALWLAAASFAFVVLSFGVGQMYVRGGG